VEPCYSQVADEQLDEVVQSNDNLLYHDIVTVREFILNHPESAHSRSSAIVSEQGIRFRYAVLGHYPFKVFWSSDRPRIEAVIPHPSKHEIPALSRGTGTSALLVHTLRHRPPGGGENVPGKSSPVPQELSGTGGCGASSH
jgi:hypothetical protein